MSEEIRLQRILARAGVASRRRSEELIAEGRVEVDGRVVVAQGVRVDPDRAVVRVDGRRVLVNLPHQYLAINKPRGVLSSMSDTRGRPTIADLLPGPRAGLFHVGRLDADSEGLLLVTNDGDLAHKLMHPSFEIQKVYLAEVRGPVARSVRRTLSGGVELDDGPVAVDRFRVVGAAGSRVMVEVTLHEGRNRVVRRLLAAVGQPVQRLVRVAVGPVRLGRLKPGDVRQLSRQELSKVFDLIDQ